ncbi:MAG TPA: hypothetical protein VGF86_14360 [Candidatus Tumulicola sp.]
MRDAIAVEAHDQRRPDRRTSVHKDARPAIDDADARTARICLEEAGLGGDGFRSLDSLSRAWWEDLRIRGPHNAGIKQREQPISIALSRSHEERFY